MTSHLTFAKKIFAIFFFSLFTISSLIAFLPSLLITTQAQSCPAGQVNAGGSCVPCPAEVQGSCGGQITCPSYQVVINGTCQACPVNSTPNNGVCVPIVCPTNQSSVNGACVPNCESGFTRNTSGSCVCQPGQNTSKGLCGPSSSTCSPSGGERSDICHIEYCQNGTNNYPSCTNCPTARAPARISNNICPVASSSQPASTQPTSTPSNNQNIEVKPVGENTQKETPAKQADATQIDANKSIEPSNDQKGSENNKSEQNTPNDKNSFDNSTNKQSESSKTTDQPKKSSNPYILPIGSSVIVLIASVSGFFGYKYWKKNKLK
jgi:hypothetical protein